MHITAHNLRFYAKHDLSSQAGGSYSSCDITAVFGLFRDTLPKCQLTKNHIVFGQTPGGGSL